MLERSGHGGCQRGGRGACSGHVGWCRGFAVATSVVRGVLWGDCLVREALRSMTLFLYQNQCHKWPSLNTTFARAQPQRLKACGIRGTSTMTLSNWHSRAKCDCSCDGESGRSNRPSLLCVKGWRADCDSENAGPPEAEV